MRGYFAPQLRYAGYDNDNNSREVGETSLLTIEDEKIEIRDATHLWGKDSFETEEIVKRDHGEKFQVFSIGPTGESLVRCACITMLEESGLEGVAPAR